MQKYQIIYCSFQPWQGEVGTYMSISSNVGRSRSIKPCSFAKCKRQMKYRCSEILVAAAFGFLLGRSCSTCDKRSADTASSFSCWAKHKLNIILSKIVLSQSRLEDDLFSLYLAHYLKHKTESRISNTHLLMQNYGYFGRLEWYFSIMASYC